MSGTDTICNWIYVLKYLSRDFRPGSKSVMQKEAAVLRCPLKVRLLRDDFGRLVFLYAVKR